jgi:predicted ester cyclase
MHPPANFALSTHYRNYINCLNHQDWSNLGNFVADDVCHNDRPLGLSGYRAMLEQDFHDIPDLRFTIALLVADATHVASRLAFDCSPQGKFLGLPVNGKRITFTENVFYEFREHKIVQVWSVIDTTAIAAQLTPPQIPGSAP